MDRRTEADRSIYRSTDRRNYRRTETDVYIDIQRQTDVYRRTRHRRILRQTDIYIDVQRQTIDRLYMSRLQTDRRICRGDRQTDRRICRGDRQTDVYVEVTDI